MIHYKQSCADRYGAPSSAFSARRSTKSVVAGAVRTLNLTVADALYAYAVTGSAFATLMALAAPIWTFSCAASSTGRDKPAASDLSASCG